MPKITKKEQQAIAEFEGKANQIRTWYLSGLAAFIFLCSFIPQRFLNFSQRWVFSLAVAVAIMALASFIYQEYFSVPKNEVEEQEEVVTAPNRVVTYQNKNRNKKTRKSPQEIKQRITDIVQANPQADLKKVESALGIKIIHVQYREVNITARTHDIDLGNP